jgi:hypothetical protein
MFRAHKKHALITHAETAAAMPRAERFALPVGGLVFIFWRGKGEELTMVHRDPIHETTKMLTSGLSLATAFVQPTKPAAGLHLPACKFH